MDLSLNATVELSNGVKMPIFGLGTWMLAGKSAYDSVKWALDMGYRLVDTATIYGNERNVGQAIKDSNTPRDEIFVTTKVWDTDQGYESTLTAFETSLKKLDVSYIDLYLIHWPVTGLRNDTWRALEKILEDGETRAIGVSNFTIRHLKELLENSSSIPTVNQVEFSPFLFQKDLLDYCKNKNIVVEAYCPLTRARKMNDPRIKAIGRKYGKSPAQVLIRWGLQHGLVEIPKSGDKNHLQENINIFDFELSEEDIEKLDNLNENFRITDDPDKWE
jgi:diketogulonate reductase-like aldo/keto reductase